MEVVRPLIIVGVALFIAMIVYSVVMAQQKPQPTVVVRPSQNKSAVDVTPSPSSVVVVPQTCTTPIMLKIYGTLICAEKVWSVMWSDSGVNVDFERGTISGVFVLVQSTCAISTSPQGVFIPCRTQILIPTASR